VTEPTPILPGITGPIWRDRDGDPWEELPDGMLRCVSDDGRGIGEPLFRTYVESFGPLIRETPRTWELPPEPGPEVRAVRTGRGYLYVRDGEWWLLRMPSGGEMRTDWNALLLDAPLTDATAEVTESTPAA
jgi:hypothetical protein